MSERTPEDRAFDVLFGCGVVAAIVIGALLAWLVGPFGPTIHVLWLKWLIAIADFLALAVLLFVGCAVLIAHNETANDWFDETCQLMADKIEANETKKAAPAKKS